MATTLAQLVVELAANTAKFQREMAGAVGEARRTAQGISRALGGIERQFTILTRGAVGFAASLGAITSIGGLGLLAKQALTFADELDEMSQRLGIGIERLQELQFAARQSGISTQQLERGIRTLADAVGDAANDSTSQAAKNFQQMGVSIKGAAGQTAPLETIMDRVADKVAAAQTPIEKINIASKAFGDRVGSFLIPILDRGAKGFDDWAKAAREAGVVVNAEMIQAAGKAKDQIDAISIAVLANLVPAITAATPVIISMANALSSVAIAAGRALGSFAPLAGQTTDQLRDRLAKIDADLALRRKQLQDIEDHNKNLRLFKSSTGTIPGEIQQLQTEREAIDKILAERAAKPIPTVRGTVIGGGQKATQELRAFRQELIDLASADPTLKTLSGISQRAEKLKEALPGASSEIDAIAQAMKNAVIEAERFKREMEGVTQLDPGQEQINAVFAEMAQQIQDARDAVAAMDVEQAKKDAAEWEETLGQVRAQHVQLAESVIESTNAEQEFAAAIPKSVTQQFNEELALINARAEVFGETFAAIGQQADLTRREIERLLALGIKPTSESVQALKRDLEDLQRVMLIEGAVKDFFGALDQALTQSITGVIQGTQTLKEAFNNMGQSIALSLIQNVIRRGINEVEKAVVELVAQLVKTGLWSFMQPGAAAQAGAAPVMVGPGSGIPGGAEGALVKHSPGGSLMFVGEGGQDEAIVPLDRLSEIAGGGGTTNVYVNITNTSDAKVSARESQTPDGRVIEVMIESAVNKGIASGRFDKAAGSSWGVSRLPVRR